MLDAQSGSTLLQSLPARISSDMSRNWAVMQTFTGCQNCLCLDSTSFDFCFVLSAVSNHSGPHAELGALSFGAKTFTSNAVGGGKVILSFSGGIT